MKTRSARAGCAKVGAGAVLVAKGEGAQRARDATSAWGAEVAWERAQGSGEADAG